MKNIILKLLILLLIITNINIGCSILYKDKIFTARLLGSYEVPSVPKGLIGDSGNIQKILLRWDLNPEYFVKGYSIYRSEKADGVYEKIATITDRFKTYYIDKGQTISDRKKTLEDKKEYFYKISASSYIDIESPLSNFIRAVTGGQPTPPSGIKGVSNLPRMALISWEPSKDLTVEGYAVYRNKGETKDGDYERIKIVEGRLNVSFVDYGLEDMTEYYYSLATINSAKVESSLIPPVKIITKSVPVPIPGVKAIGGQIKKIILKWEKGKDEDIISHYIIWRTEDESKEFKKIAVVEVDTYEYSDLDLEDGKEYFYQIQAVSLDGIEGEFSDTVYATTRPLPHPPEEINITSSNNTVRLSWKSQSPDVKEYNIYKKGIFFFERYGTTTDITFVDRNVDNGKSVSYVLTAVDEYGLESERSDIVTIEVE